MYLDYIRCYFPEIYYLLEIYYILKDFKWISVVYYTCTPPQNECFQGNTGISLSVSPSMVPRACLCVHPCTKY